MNFIELNRWMGPDNNKTIHIHTMMITALSENTTLDALKTTTVYLMGDQSFTVSDTVDEIKKKIKESEIFKITTFGSKESN
jgi:hypothetical protein